MDIAENIVIVGAGPTGVMLAIELARRGVEVDIVDKQPARSPESRAITLHARTLEIFNQLAVVERFLERGHRLDGAEVHTRARRGLRVHFNGIDSPYPFMLALSQAETQRILEERLEELGVRVQRGVRVVGVHQDLDGVELHTVRAGAGGDRERTVRARWVIGCDGAHSIVRRSLGLSFDGEDYAQDWLMAEVNIDGRLARDRFHVFAYTAPPLPVFPMPGGRWRVFFPEVANRSRDGRPPDMGEIEQLVAARGPAGVKLSDPSLLATFRCYRRSTDMMRSGRVLIAGDAAHIHSPAGGQGLNTGLQDAFNLGWKLALVAEGHAPASLLDSYQAERGPIAARVITLSHALVRTFTIASPGRRWLRDRLLPAVEIPPIERRLATRMAQLSHNYRGGPLAPEVATRAQARHPGRPSSRPPAPGDRLPDVSGLRLGAREVSTLELLRAPIHTLLVLPGRRPRPALVEDAVGRCARWKGLMRTIVIDDPGLRAHRRYGAMSGLLVLVRPDGYVAATAPLDRPDAIELYLARLGLAGGALTPSAGRDRPRRQLAVGIREQGPRQLRARAILDERTGVGEGQHQPDG